MAEQPEQDEPKGWRAFFIRAARESAAADSERNSIWSVRRPLTWLYLFLFSVQSGWLFWKVFRDTVAEHPGSGWELIAFETLGGVSGHALGAAVSSLLATEGVSTLMVMYNMGMSLIVRPIIKWHERRGEARGREEGIAIGEERADQAWRAWNQRRLDAQERGEPFDEPLPRRHSSSSVEKDNS